jgi:hypothetical protein
MASHYKQSGHGTRAILGHFNPTIRPLTIRITLKFVHNVKQANTHNAGRSPQERSRLQSDNLKLHRIAQSSFR